MSLKWNRNIPALACGPTLLIFHHLSGLQKGKDLASILFSLDLHLSFHQEVYLVTGLGCEKQVIHYISLCI